MAREVSIVVKAYNQTKAAFKSIGQGLRDLTRGDFKKGFGRMFAGVQQMAKTAGGALAGLGRMAGMAASAAAAAGVAVIAVAKKALDAYQKSAQSEDRLAQVLKNTAYAAGFTSSELKKMATELQKTTGIEDEATLGVMSLLAATGKIRGDMFTRATVAALDMGAAMRKSGADAAEVEGAAQALSIALQDPAEGMSRLSRQGIRFTEAKQNEIKAMAEAGKLQEAQAAILTEIEKRYAGTAEAAHKQTKAQTDLKNNFGDLMEQVGQAINESDGFKSIMENLADVVRRLSESGYIELWAQRISTAMSVAAKAIKPIVVLFGAIKTGVEKAAAFAGGFASGQGGIMDRIAAGKEAASKTEENEADELAAIKAAKAKKEADKAAAEQKEKAAAKDELARRDAEDEAARLAEIEKKAAKEREKAAEKALALAEKRADIEQNIADKMDDIESKNIFEKWTTELDKAEGLVDSITTALEKREAMGGVGSQEFKEAARGERRQQRADEKMAALRRKVGLAPIAEKEFNVMSAERKDVENRRAKLMARLGMGGPGTTGTAEEIEKAAARKGLKLSKRDVEALRRAEMNDKMMAEAQKAAVAKANIEGARNAQAAKDIADIRKSVDNFTKDLTALLQSAPG